MDDLPAKIKEAVKARRIVFQCCFCREAVEREDVSAVILIVNWGQDEEKQRSQQWFCHPECFQKVTQEPIDVLEKH